MIIVGGPVIFLLLLLAFKPVRMIVGWLLFAVLCIGLYACAQMPPAHAQSSPMVQCQIGSWAQVMPDYACEAMEAGAVKLNQERSDTEGMGIVALRDWLNSCLPRLDGDKSPVQRRVKCERPEQFEHPISRISVAVPSRLRLWI